jgi:hypothetical protein
MPSLSVPYGGAYESPKESRRHLVRAAHPYVFNECQRFRTVVGTGSPRNRQGRRSQCHIGYDNEPHRIEPNSRASRSTTIAIPGTAPTCTSAGRLPASIPNDLVWMLWT